MKRINSDKAMAMAKAGAMLVDMRSPVAFRDGHIVGAVNLPLRNFVNRLVVTNKKTKIVIYSDEADDIKHGLNYATNLGFADVFVTDYK